MDIETCLIYFVIDEILAGKSPVILRGYKYSVSLLMNYTRNNFMSQDSSALDVESLTDLTEVIEIQK